MKTPLVSICVPNLNKRPFLQARMESLLSQTFHDWELIVCDSHSTDGSWEFLQRYSHDSRVRLCQVPREGLYAGWNECLRRAAGRYVYMATSDDTCESCLVEKLVAALERFPECRVAVCDFLSIDHAGNPIEDTDVAKREFYGEWMRRPSIRDGKTEFVLHACFLSSWVTMTSVLFRHDLLDRVGMFRTDSGPAADIEWVLRAALMSDVVYVPERLATWRRYAQQSSADTSATLRAWYMLRGVRSVIHDPASGIPVAWRRAEERSPQIELMAKAQYLDTLRLDRRAARSAPAQFLRGCLAAAQTAPGFLVRQCLRGFCWDPRLSPDPVVHARTLLASLGAEWPPRGVSS